MAAQKEREREREREWRGETERGNRIAAKRSRKSKFDDVALARANSSAAAIYVLSFVP